MKYGEEKIRLKHHYTNKHLDGYDISIKKCTPSEYKFEIEQLFVEGDNYYFIDFVFKTYEEAELKCLKKLIEIVKK